MSKIIAPILTIASIALMLIPGPNIAVLGVTIGLHALIGVGLGLAAAVITSATAPKPKANQANVSRLTVTLDPTAPRKASFGITALATDMQYGAYTGTNQDHYDQIVCAGAHEVHSIDEIWFDNQQAWTSGGGVTSAYSGYLSVDVRTVGTRTNGIGIDGTWTSNSTLTGCAYVHLRYKLTGNSSSATSPFSSSIPTRFTLRGHGALVYDARLDSTVAGGSGSQRANDQTTWAWNDSASRNPALQLLFYLLGWRIQNPSTGAWKLSVGRGIPAARLDLPSFITAANVCDETISLAAGGTEPRYRSDGVFSEGDDPSTALSNLLASMNATLRDAGGKISVVCYTNDLGSPVPSFTEVDIIGNESWEQSPPFNQIFNVVRGRYTNPSDTALYQLTDYPEVSLSSVDGIDRIDPVDFSNVQSASQAQRLAKQRLQRSQYQGKYTADFGARAWQVSLGQIVQISHASLGWTNKLFRVTGQSIGQSGIVKMILVEENAAIYAWSAEDSAPVTPGTPTVYNPLNDPIVQGIVANVSTVTLYLRQYAPPSTPTGDNPSGWTAAIPSGSETLWKVAGTKSQGVLVGVWSAPVVDTQGLARAYDGGTTWYLGNACLFNGGTYEALQNGFSGQAPSGTSAATAYWGVRAAPGAAGAPGSPPSSFSATINLTSGAAVNLRTVADANGYTGASDATITYNVPSGVTCRGLSGGGIGIDTGTWPSGYTIALALVVQSGGIVDGGGGVGGDASLGAGGAGGDAIYCRVDMSGGITINSGGIVRAGGGGGGGGSGHLDTPPGQFSSPDDPYDGGGGGGGGAPNGAGGAGEAGDNGGTNGSNGSAGTTSGGGAGGGGWQSGGNGGGFAAAGSSGTDRGAGGAAGYAVRKNGHTVTVSNSGTMTGSAA